MHNAGMWSASTFRQSHKILFWTALSGLFLGYLLVGLEVQFADLLQNIDDKLVFVLAISTLVFVSLVIFIASPVQKFRTQRLHNLPSWVFYYHFGLATAPLFSYGLSKLLYQQILTTGLWERVLLFVLITGLYFFIKGKDYSEDRYAADSAGIENDKLDFKHAARNAAKGIVASKHYVSVLGLYGEMGAGKSSFLRMMVESIEPVSTRLYTYISLTETNEAKDFGKLFAQRWNETISARYPKIYADELADGISTLRPILRQANTDFLSSLFALFGKLNKPFLNVQAKIGDPLLGRKLSSTTSAISQIFGGIPDFKEDFWIIVIDEIERAQFEEIYRVIEVIERFKIEGRTGLPIRLVFILCISRGDLFNTLNDFEDKHPLVPPIKRFLEDPKSVTQPEFLPPITAETKDAFIRKEAEELYGEAFGNTDAKEIVMQLSGFFYESSHSFDFLDSSKSFAFVGSILRSETPRVIKRTIREALFFYKSFSSMDGLIEKRFLRVSDVLLLSYAKVRYPYLIEFFIKTIHLILPTSESHRMLGYFKHQELKENKISLEDWIKNETGAEVVNPAEKDRVKRIIATVAHSYLDLFEQGDIEKGTLPYEEENSTSSPSNLWAYLTVTDGVKTPFQKDYEMYKAHKDDQLKLQELETRILLEYSRFLERISEFDLRLNFEVANEIRQRIIKNDIPFAPKDVGDTIYDDAIYRFVFKIKEMILRDRYQEYTQNAVALFKDILHSNTSTVGKYLLLNSFGNHTRGSGSSIHYELGDAFSKMLQYDATIADSLKHVFEEAEKRYFKGQLSERESIYECEENFFYLLYQSWSGDKEQHAEIKKIRDAAKRGLERDADAIAMYWNAYPIKKGWRKLADAMEDDFSFRSQSNREVYMTLSDLIEITKKANINDSTILAKMNFWQDVMIQEPEPFAKLSQINDDKGTLKAALLERNFLQG